MNATRTLAVLAILFTVLTAGCGANGKRGPVTFENVVQGYPPEVFWVSVDARRCLAGMGYQPYDAYDQDVQLKGWYLDAIRGRWELYLTQSVMSSSDNTRGEKFWVVANSNWPSSWGGLMPMSPSDTYDWLASVIEPPHSDGSQRRQVATVWETAGGTTVRLRCRVIPVETSSRGITDLDALYKEMLASNIVSNYNFEKQVYENTYGPPIK